MTFAIAQTRPRETVEENLRDHCRMLDVAAQHRADLIVFPEMSMTGYTREKAAELAFERIVPSFLSDADFRRSRCDRWS